MFAAIMCLALTSPATAVSKTVLAAQGDWIIDAEGRVVILHGVNMVNKLPPYTPEAAGFGREDARFVARHGFNTVRLGFAWTAVEPQ